MSQQNKNPGDSAFIVEDSGKIKNEQIEDESEYAKSDLIYTFFVISNIIIRI